MTGRTEPSPAVILTASVVKRDLRPAPTEARQLIRDALEGLAAGVGNLDIKAVVDHRPWLRLRAGDWRILYRPLTTAELPPRAKSGYLIARIVNRRDLHRAAKSL